MWKRFHKLTEAKVWIINNQFGRRNIADIDRISLGMKRQEILSPKAKEQQVSALKKGSSVPAKLPKREPIDTRKEAAKVAGVGERTYDAGKMILDAPPAPRGRSTPRL